MKPHTNFLALSLALFIILSCSFCYGYTPQEAIGSVYDYSIGSDRQTTDGGFVEAQAEPSASDYYDAVQKAYIAYYQRPADPVGLIYWADRLSLAGGNLNSIVEAFGNSGESQSLYGTISSSTIGGVITGIYQALFGRDPDAEGLAFYANGFDAGTFTASTIALNILDGARNDDLSAAKNKLQVANVFTRAIDPELDGLALEVTYRGDADAQKAREFLMVINASQDYADYDVAKYIWANIADPDDVEFETYEAMIVNESSSEITGIALEMVGAGETISLDRLAPGEGTEYYRFLLPEPHGSIPISYGDYRGRYTQAGEPKDIFIPIPPPRIIIWINDDSWSVEEVNPGDTRNYFPFGQGNTWKFRGISSGVNAPGGFINTITIAGVKEINGVQTTAFREDNPDGSGQPVDDFRLKDGTGITYFGNTGDGNKITPWLVPFQGVKFPLQPGESVHVQKTEIDYGSDLDGDGRNETLDASILISVQGFETVTVPVGAFADSLKLEMAVEAILTYSKNGAQEKHPGVTRQAQWLAPGIGLIKRVTITDYGYAERNVTEELVEYDVDGNQGTALLGINAAVSNCGGFPEYHEGRSLAAHDSQDTYERLVWKYDADTQIVSFLDRDVEANCASGFTICIVRNPETGVYSIEETESTPNPADCLCLYDLKVDLPGIALPAEKLTLKLSRNGRTLWTGEITPGDGQGDVPIQ
ncbi:MAG: DUF4214 domain-containing protein [Pseudomonadota bacterium]